MALDFKSFGRLLSSIKKEKDIYDVEDLVLNDLAGAGLAQMIEEGDGDSILSQLLAHDNKFVRVVAEKRFCRIKRYQ